MLQVKLMLAQALSIDVGLIHDKFTSSDHENWDSLANMTIASVFADVHNVKIGYDEVFRLNSVERLVEYLENKIAENDFETCLPLEKRINEPVSENENNAQSNSSEVDFDLLPLLSFEKIGRRLNSIDFNNVENIQQQPLAIASTYTVQGLSSSLALWFRGLNVKADITLCDFNQIEHMLISEHSPFYENQSMNIILVRPEDLITPFDQDGVSRADSIIHAISIYTEKSKNMLIVGDMPPVVSSFYYAEKNIAKKLASHWNAALEKLPSIMMLPISDIIISLGIQASRNTEAEVIARSPYSHDVYQSIAMNLCRLVRSCNTPAKKVIAVDADNTLWGGVIGEEGLTGIQLGDDHPGRSFQLFQRQLLAMKHNGVLLALVSKNEESDVLQVLDEHPGMQLKLSDFSSTRINWKRKSDNLRSIAEELNLGLDAFVFIDDSPMECDEVKANAADVTVIQLPNDPLAFGEILEKIWLFDSPHKTNEDSIRNNFIQNNVKREKLKNASVNLAGYLQSLNISVTMKQASLDEKKRVSQLSQKTNQFNTSLIRRSYQEVLDLDDNYSVWVLSVSDKFGDYGIVGACILEKTMQGTNVDSLYLSCRALGRQVEDAFLYGINSISQDNNEKKLSFFYREGPRNQQVKNFLERLGFLYENEKYESVNIMKLPEHIEWKLKTVNL